MNKLLTAPDISFLVARIGCLKPKFEKVFLNSDINTQKTIYSVYFTDLMCRQLISYLYQMSNDIPIETRKNFDADWNNAFNNVLMAGDTTQRMYRIQELYNFLVSIVDPCNKYYIEKIDLLSEKIKALEEAIEVLKTKHSE